MYKYKIVMEMAYNKSWVWSYIISYSFIFLLEPLWENNKEQSLVVIKIVCGNNKSFKAK